VFQDGLEHARLIKFQVPSEIIETGWARAASFPRQNGSGVSIVSDLKSGSWLLATGTWLHADDYGSGAESRLLDRYLEVGAERLGRELEGFFVIVVGDARNREVIVLTDVVGSCHCFSRSWENVTALSGSSLLLAALQAVDLDPVACQEFLYTGIIYEDRTCYREVRKLGPAAVFRFVDGMLRTQQRYWRITDIAPNSLDGQAAVRALEGTLIRAAQRIGRLFGHPVCDLTGGYDSRALVAAFLTAGMRFSTTVFGPAESRDVIVSRGLASLTGLPLLHLAPQGEVSFERVKYALSFTDGEYNLIDYARILEVHQRLSACFDISINGSFGEVGRGYWWELLFPRAGACRTLNARTLARSRYAAQSYDASLFPPETRLDLVAHVAAIIERANAGLSQLPNTMQMDHAYLMLRMQRWQGRIASSTDQLWPCLSPFLLRSILETLLRTAVRLRRRGLLIRRLLAELQPRLAAFPLEHGYPALPVTWKNFHRFWPVPVFYGKKILGRAVRLTGRTAVLPVSGPTNLPVQLQLWHGEEVRALLQPATMKLAYLMDATALNDFLQHSQRPGFSYNDQWARLLSLEYTLHILELAKTRLAARVREQGFLGEPLRKLQKPPAE